jgi:hypothetical protein
VSSVRTWVPQHAHVTDLSRRSCSHQARLWAASKYAAMLCKAHAVQGIVVPTLAPKMVALTGNRGDIIITITRGCDTSQLGKHTRDAVCSTAQAQAAGA